MQAWTYKLEEYFQPSRMILDRMNHQHKMENIIKYSVCKRSEMQNGNPIFCSTNPLKNLQCHCNSSHNSKMTSIIWSMLTAMISINPLLPVTYHIENHQQSIIALTPQISQVKGKINKYFRLKRCKIIWISLKY